jgi:3-hydroxybutyryl-CoA dehydrogenase
MVQFMSDFCEGGVRMQQIKRVAIVGCGFMGMDIAITAAKNTDNELALYDASPAVLAQAKQSAQFFLTPLPDGPAILKRIHFCNELAEALAGADLVIEAVPENLEMKRRVFTELDQLAPPQAILGTNSSSLPVSRIEDVTGRPDRVMNIHFYPPISQRNMVDLMGGTKTSAETFETVTQWVRALRCVPLKVRKELIGFCFNRVWHMARLEAMKMWAAGFVDFMDIDRAWMIFNNTPLGPFAMMDFIGLDVVYAVHSTYFEEYGELYKPPDMLKKMVEEGKLGVKSSRGFYEYPDPAYARPDFLKP